jgi:hypothetical protein
MVEAKTSTRARIRAGVCDNMGRAGGRMGDICGGMGARPIESRAYGVRDIDTRLIIGFVGDW